MDNQTVLTTVVVVLALFIWVPAIVVSVRQVLRKGRSKENKKN